jgi:hypothetical protein
MESVTEFDRITTAPALDVDPLPNLPLLRRVLDHIDAHADLWNQGHWGRPEDAKCGTAMCIAGWATELADGWSSGHPRSAARDLLGLTEQEADDLFLETITPGVFGVWSQREAVQIVASRIAARAGEVL